MFLKNKNIIFKIRRSKVTDYAALSSFLACGDFCCLLITFSNSLDPDQDQRLHRLEKYLNIQDCLEKSLKIKFP